MASKITMANTIASATLALVIGVHPIAGALIGYTFDKGSAWGIRQVNAWSASINTALALPDNSALRTAVKIAMHLVGLLAYSAVAALVLSVGGYTITIVDVAILSALPLFFMCLYNQNEQPSTRPTVPPGCCDNLNY